MQWSLTLIAHILVVDDDSVQRRLLKNAVERHGHIAHLAENGRAGLEVLKRRLGEINVIVLDLVMPEMNGLAFLAALHDLGIEIPVIVQTGQGGIETVVQAMRAGAFDFVVKPVSPERIANSIANALKVDQREAKARAGRKSRATGIGFDDIVSASPSMLRVIELAQRAAQSHIPVVLEGESGVGKELVARAIQSGGDRANKPFITVNCGAIPHNLVESILFGHEKGAFTGAAAQRRGRFEQADGGTLFLDEIGDMPAELQTRLLRVLADGQFYRVGGHAPIKVNVRVIAATHQDLEVRVRDGLFREDLFHRLNVIRLRLPPLRERREDIPLLLRHFMQKSARELGVEVKGVSEAALKILVNLPWSGNVRQLENVSHYLTVMAPGQVVEAGDLPADLMQGMAVPAGSDWLQRLAAEAGARLARGEAAILDELTQAYEKTLIEVALRHTGGRRIEAAHLLGWGRNTLTRKIHELGMDDAAGADEAG